MSASSHEPPTEQELREWRSIRGLAMPGPRTLREIYLAFSLLLDDYDRKVAELAKLRAELGPSVAPAALELSGPAPERAPLNDALTALRDEYPAARLFEVRLGFCLGEREDHPEFEMERKWHRVSWSVQVGNESGSGATFDEARHKLREELDWDEQVPEKARALAALLREIPAGGFRRNDVLQAAQRLVETEERQARVVGHFEMAANLI